MALSYITLTDSLSCQLPFVRGPEDFSEDLQLTKLPSQLAESALLVKLEHMKKCEIVDPTVHVTQQRQLKLSLGGAKAQKTKKSSNYKRQNVQSGRVCARPIRNVCQ